MSVSGVEVSEEIKKMVIDMTTVGKKEGGAKKKEFLYLVFKLNKIDDKNFEWVLKSQKDKPEAFLNHKQVPREEFKPYYQDFVDSELKNCNEPIFCLFDFAGCADPTKKNRFSNVAAFRWCPDDCGVKLRMVYASSVQGFGKSTPFMETSDLEDYEFDKMFKKV